MDFSFSAVRHGESAHLEFKREFPAKKENFLKTVSAFSNTSGGFIIFGIDDKTKEIMGIPEENQFLLMDQIANCISDSIIPQVSPEITLRSHKQKTVVVVQIFPGAACPYYINSLGKENGTFIRVGATSRPADDISYKELEMIGSRRSYDGLQSRPLLQNDHQYNDTITQKLCDDIARFMQHDEKEHPYVTKETLESLGVLKRINNELLPTNAYGILTNSYLTEYSGSIVRCACFKGIDKVVFLDKRDCEGPIYDQIEQAYQFVLKHINLGVKIEGILGLNRYELPPDAIREAIINAIVHRNYMFTEHVQVAVFDDRVEIISPGSLPHGITLEQALDGMSLPRNPVIAKVFQRMHIMEEWGSGLRRIQAECTEYNVNRPKFIVSEIDFKIIFYRGPTIPELSKKCQETVRNWPETFPETARKTFEYIKAHPESTNKEIGEALEITERSVRNHCAILKSDGYIRRNGSDKTGFWEILKEE